MSFIVSPEIKQFMPVKELPKMVGNSFSYPFKSWPTHKSLNNYIISNKQIYSLLKNNYASINFKVGINKQIYIWLTQNVAKIDNCTTYLLLQILVYW